MSDEPPIILIVGTYLVLVLLILPSYMKNRKPYELMNVIRCYNVFQIISNTIILYAVSIFMISNVIIYQKVIKMELKDT